MVQTTVTIVAILNSVNITAIPFTIVIITVFAIAIFIAAVIITQAQSRFLVQTRGW